MNIRPIGDNILIRRLDTPGRATLLAPSELLQTALKIPDSWVAKSIRGEVLAVGRGTLSAMGHLFPLAVRVGDVVWFDHRAGNEIKLGAEPILIIKESEILAVE